MSRQSQSAASIASVSYATAEKTSIANHHSQRVIFCVNHMSISQFHKSSSESPLTIVSRGSVNSHHDYHHQSIQQHDCESSLTIKRRDRVSVPIHALHYFDCESPLTNNDATSADDSRHNAQSSKVVNGDSQSAEQWQEIFSGTVSFTLIVSIHSQTSVTGDDFSRTTAQVCSGCEQSLTINAEEDNNRGTFHDSTV